LRRAINRGELVLHYQPKIALATGEFLGVEALVRWEHPERGLVFPDEFIALAERTGVMADLTAFVLEEALRQHATWMEADLEIPVAVNLSVEDLSDVEFPARLVALCADHGVGSDALGLEVTESGVMADPDRAIAVLQGLGEAGFALSIDDFGTGFSSLAYLRRLPVSLVKIDKSFVVDLPHSDADAHIVRGTVELVHGLGKRVVAEGVESAEAAKFLVLVGCDAGQGYFWSRPLAPVELARWARQYQGNRSLELSSTPIGSAPLPVDETERLTTLRRYRILDTSYEAIFDDIASIAARICGTPISAISLIDSDRQWFKAQVGLKVRETSRSLAFCAHTIMDPDRILVVTDAVQDERFASNSLVTGDPNIRFYAGAPLITPDGHAIGSMCVIDTTPRELTSEQLGILRHLADDVIAILEVKRHMLDLAAAEEASSFRS
jgi:EAL domain-containing protein (putative c-di-GMP-specific phosphodiesterase class I)